MTSDSKKMIATIAAIQILLYHCWIPVFGYGTIPGSVERFLVSSTYSGVDLFFFISAFSLVSKPVTDYPGFIKNRALKILPLFFIALIFGKFLWFIPSIMTVYLLLPPLYNICSKKPVLSFYLLLISWAALLYLILGIIRPARDPGIFLFRIPSIILGAYAVKYKEKLNRRQTIIAGILLFTAGMILEYRFGYINRLNHPFNGTFYLTGIPVMLGTVMIADQLASNHGSELINRFGSMTLELYFTQMVFGTFLTGLIFRMTGSRIITNLTVIAAITAISAVIKRINDRIMIRSKKAET